MTDDSYRPVRRITEDRSDPLDRSRWPATIPAVAQLLDEGLELTGLTVLVGENGSGKSTVVEGIAMAYGMSPEGGSTLAAHTTRRSESVLADHLLLARGIRAPRWGYFLRAETMHGFYTYLEQNPPSPRRVDPVFHDMSHGESLLTLLAERFDGPGLYVMDEPEAGLSFSSTLALAGLLADMAASKRSQAIVATHSPLLAAVPGAVVYEVDDQGLRRCDWPDLALVRHWRAFLHRPQEYLRHLGGQ